MAFPDVVDYGWVLDRALEITLGAMESGKVAFQSEGDLRAYLYHSCAKLLEVEGNLPRLPLHAEFRVGPRTTADLALGSKAEVLVELKFEPWHTENGSLFALESGGDHSIERDVKKIERYASDGKIGHLIVVEKRYVDGRFYFPDSTARIGIPRDQWAIGKRYSSAHIVRMPKE